MNLIDRVQELVNKHALKAVSVTTLLSGGNFLIMLLQALADGKITDEELHQLITASSGIETLVLAVVIYFLRRQNKK